MKTTLTTRRARAWPRQAALMLLAAIAVLAGACAGAPQAVLHAPGTYTANIGGNSATAQVLVCIDEATALEMSVELTPPVVGNVRLTFGGQVLDGNPLITPVLPVGCYSVAFGVGACCILPDTATLTVTKVP